MSTPILSAKFYIPRPRADLLPRPRLVRRLAEGLANPLVLISAPAGFGKTTLLSEWVESLPPQTSSPQPATVAWLSLEPEDNDTLRFLTYLVSALDVLQPGFLNPVAALLHSPLPPQPNDFLAELKICASPMPSAWPISTRSWGWRCPTTILPNWKPAPRAGSPD
jgi:LuxR family maltose regulon positive regulatory protein